MNRKGITAAVAAWAALGGVSAHAAQQPQASARCVTADQASGLMLVLLPGALKAMQGVCTNVLPQTALLRRLPPAFLAKYETAAAGAWPRAGQAISAISGDAIDESQMAMIRPMIDAMAAPMLAGVLKPETCQTADRVATLLEPLPAENLAALVVTFIEARGAEKAREAAAGGTTDSGSGGTPDVTICPTTPTAN